MKTKIFLQKAIKLKNLTTINILLLLSYIITTREKLSSEIFDQNLNQANLATKANIANFIDNTDFNRKFWNSATKTKLNSEWGKIQKLHAFYSSYSRGKSHFDGDDGTQKYSEFQPGFTYFKKPNSDRITAGSLKGCQKKELHLLIVLLDL